MQCVYSEIKLFYSYNIYKYLDVKVPPSRLADHRCSKHIQGLPAPHHYLRHRHLNLRYRVRMSRHAPQIEKPKYTEEVYLDIGLQIDIIIIIIVITMCDQSLTDTRTMVVY